MRSGWRHLLRRHGSDFLQWLDEDGVQERVVESLAADVQSFTLAALHDRDAAKAFREAIPDVLARCDEDIYDRPLRAETYAFMHLLERYRRAWRVLCELTATRTLPLAIHGVRTLDVGTGPAPVLFAVSDFYRELDRFANARGVPSLQLPPPELNSVEASSAMERYVHHFCEASGRMSGPFRAEWQDLTTFDPAARREARFRARVAAIIEEDETSEAHARWWVQENEGWLQGAHTFRLCVFSNFLTEPDFVDAQSERLAFAFDAVTPGGVVVVMGGVGDRYPAIYAKVESLATKVGLRRLDVREQFAAPCTLDPVGAIIKRVYRAVWSRLGELGHAETDGLDRLRDLWDPAVPYSTSSFALLAFRRDGTHG
jgi:hypothetical protein